MSVGVLIAAQLIWPALNFDTLADLQPPAPLHTNAVIFAFGCSALMATSFYVVQRTCQTRLFGGPLASFVFWGWQAIILSAAISLPLGYTTSKGTPSWNGRSTSPSPWSGSSYAIVFFGTLVKRTTSHIYVANWFFGAFIITVAVLHIVNNMEVPLSGMKSYSMYSGAMDAMVQWWYGHNAVGFLLTAGFLGMMYFVPKQAGRRSTPTASPSCTSGR
jgi:cytochrome c oxidase cbb3-type subunit 1